MKGEGRGWITASTACCCTSTGSPWTTEAARGKQGGRTVEIQRLISRFTARCCRYQKLGENTIIVDCDVFKPTAVRARRPSPALVLRSPTLLPLQKKK